MDSYHDEVRQLLLTRMPDWLEGKLRAFNLSILNVERLAGGPFHEIWQMNFVFHHDMAPDYMNLVVRRDVPSREQPEGGTARHFALLKLLKKTDIPAPVPFWVERSDDILGAPFLTMEVAEGETAPDYFALDNPERTARLRSYVGALSKIHMLDWRPAKFDEVLGAPSSGDTAQQALERVIVQVEGDGADHLIAGRALDWLRAHTPATSEIRLVHGTPGLSNYRFEGSEVVAVLDWKAAALSDPLADIGDICAGIAGAMGDEAAAVRERDLILGLYRDESGISYEDLPFWEVLSLLKAARRDPDASVHHWRRLAQIIG